MSDSAGVRIIVSSAQLAGAELYRLSDRAVVDIRGVSGDSRNELTQVRSATRLSGGGIVVVQSSVRPGVQELRVFDDAGRFVRIIGRQGDGPGEFRALDRISDWRATLRSRSIARAA